MTPTAAARISTVRIRAWRSLLMFSFRVAALALREVGAAPDRVLAEHDEHFERGLWPDVPARRPEEGHFADARSVPRPHQRPAVPVGARQLAWREHRYRREPHGSQFQYRACSCATVAREPAARDRTQHGRRSCLQRQHRLDATIRQDYLPEEWYNGSNVRDLSERQRDERHRLPIVEDERSPALQPINLSGRKNLQFRVDMLNALNRMHYANPNLTPTSTQFGRVTAASGSVMRFVTFITKLSF